MKSPRFDSSYRRFLHLRRTHILTKKYGWLDPRATKGDHIVVIVQSPPHR